MGIVEEPLENLFAEELAGKIDFYEICSNHREHNRNSRSNKYPSFRLDPRDLAFWDKESPEDIDTAGSVVDLEMRIVNNFWEDILDTELDGLKGFKMFPDMNGYRILLNTPIYELWIRRDEVEEDIKTEQESQKEFEKNREFEMYDASIVLVEGYLDEIKEIDEELLECLTAYAYFKKIVEELKESFDNYVWIICEDGSYDFVDKEFYEDMKDEYNWKLWQSQQDTQIKQDEEDKKNG